MLPILLHANYMFPWYSPLMLYLRSVMNKCMILPSTTVELLIIFLLYRYEPANFKNLIRFSSHPVKSSSSKACNHLLQKLDLCGLAIFLIYSMMMNYHHLNFHLAGLHTDGELAEKHLQRCEMIWQTPSPSSHAFDQLPCRRYLVPRGSLSPPWRS